MSLCAWCGLPPPDDVGLCPHHHVVHDDDDWAVANRIMCDFVHRRRVPRRLTEAERADDVNAVTVTLEAEGTILPRVTSGYERDLVTTDQRPDIGAAT